MKPRNLAIVALIAVLAAVGIWYVSQPAPAEPVKAAAAPKPAAPTVEAPKVAPPTQIAAPVAAPVQVAAAKPAPAPTPAPAADAVKELDTAIGDMVSMLQAGDMVGLMDKYAPPEELARMTPEMRAQMLQAMQSPQMQQQFQMMAQALQSLQGQTPTFNDTGDHATYQMSPPPGMVPPGRAAPESIPVNFIKVNGRWYAGSGQGGF